MVVSKFCLTRNIKMLVDMSIFGEILIVSKYKIK